MADGAADPVVIVGAGIAGLTLAAGLQRAGERVVVLEERPELTEAGAGISLWPNALAALDRIDLGEAVRRAGVAVPSGSMRRWDGRWLRRIDADRLIAALGEPVVTIHRAALARVLLDAVDPASIELGRGVRSLRPVDGAVEVETADGARVRGRAVVGADGTRSAVARWIDPGIETRYSGYTAWRAVARCSTIGVEAGSSIGRGRECGFGPIGPDTTYWFATERTPEGGSSPGGELAHLREALAGWHDPFPELLAATREEDVLRHDIVDRTVLDPWGRGLVTTIGDAAHPMRPHLGQGGCQAIEDAVALAPRLCGRSDPAELERQLRDLERARRRRTQAIVRESAMLGRLLVRDGAVGALVARGAGLMPLGVVLRHLAAVAGRQAFTA